MEAAHSRPPPPTPPPGSQLPAGTLLFHIQVPRYPPWSSMRSVHSLVDTPMPSSWPQCFMGTFLLSQPYAEWLRKSILELRCNMPTS